MHPRGEVSRCLFNLINAVHAEHDFVDGTLTEIFASMITFHDHLSLGSQSAQPEHVSVMMVQQPFDSPSEEIGLILQPGNVHMQSRVACGPRVRSAAWCSTFCNIMGIAFIEHLDIAKQLCRNLFRLAAVI